MRSHLLWIAISCVTGCTLLGAFDGDYALDEAAAAAGGGSGGGMGSPNGQGGDGGGDGGGDATCAETCVTGYCEGQVCTQWVQTFGGEASTNVRFVASAPDGTVFVAGDYEFTLTIGSSVLTSVGERDNFIAAFARDGTPRWAKTIGGPYWDEPAGLAVDDDGDLFVTMRCMETNFPPHGTRGTAGGEDICVAKLSAEGDIAWAVSYGSPTWETPWGIAANGDGVFVVGEFDTSIAIGPHTLYAATIGGFVTRLNKDSGQPVWARDISSPHRSVVTAVTANGGALAIGGEFAGDADVGGVMLMDDDASMDLFVARLDASDGSAFWATRMHNVGGQVGYAFVRAVTNVGPDVIVAGGFDGSWDFGTGPVAALGLQGFVTRQGAGQTGVWHKATTGAMFSEIVGLASTPHGDVMLTGMFEGGPVRFGGHDMSSGSEPYVMSAFVAHINPEGGVDGATALGGLGQELLAPPHVHLPTGNLLLAGSFDGTLDFGPNVSSAVGFTGFVMSYGEY